MNDLYFVDFKHNSFDFTTYVIGIPLQPLSQLHVVVIILITGILNIIIRMIIFRVRIINLHNLVHHFFLCLVFFFFYLALSITLRQEFEHIGELTTKKSDGEINYILESLTGYDLMSKRKKINN